MSLRSNRLWCLVTGILIPWTLAAQQPVWTQLPGSPPGTSPRNDDIIFVDELRGWAARATDGIYRTTNSGLTFEKVRSSTIAYPGGNVTAHFRSIGFASATRGWAGNLGPGSYDASVTDTNILYETMNGGDTWSPVLSVSATDIKGLCAMHVLDDQRIFGGGRVRGPAHFIKTSDGGANWSVTNLTTAGVMGGIMDVCFHDAMNGFLVGMGPTPYTSDCSSGYHGRIVRTTDGGATWTPVADTPVACSYFWKMSWPSTNTGYATLQQNGAYNTVIYYKTIDGGATWSSNGVPLVAIGASSFFLQGIGFPSETEGWMGGSSTVAAPFNFIHTINGGLSWEVAGYDDTRSMNRIRFNSPTFGYASGRKLHIYRMPLAIVANPDSKTVQQGEDVDLSVTAQGLGALSYRWRFEGTDLPGAVSSTLSITNAQPTDAGGYDVVASDVSGSITSSVATLTVVAPLNDDFDAYVTPETVVTLGPTNGYDLVFSAASGPVDFTAVFGFDYSTVTYPTNIPSAPNSVGGTTRGLRLSVNKDPTGAPSVVLLYPSGHIYTGNFSLKCDVWLNWANSSVSTEHALFGINHSGLLPLRPGLSPSDGLFFALAAEGGCSATSTTLRDYSVFRGTEAGAPVLMLTNTATFGPAPLLGPQFDNQNPGMTNLFPARSIPPWGTTAAGGAGLQWVEVDVRQVNGLVTWALNGAVVAQYTNLFGYIDGNVAVGYLDHFSSVGDSDSFLVLDNLRVESAVIEPIELVAGAVSGGNFSFRFHTERYAPYVVEWAPHVDAAPWNTYTNVLGDGSELQVVVPLAGSAELERYFRVVRH